MTRGSRNAVHQSRVCLIVQLDLLCSCSVHLVSQVSLQDALYASL